MVSCDTAGQRPSESRELGLVPAGAAVSVGLQATFEKPFDLSVDPGKAYSLAYVSFVSESWVFHASTTLGLSPTVREIFDYFSEFPMAVCPQRWSAVDFVYVDGGSGSADWFQVSASDGSMDTTSQRLLGLYKNGMAGHDLLSLTVGNPTYAESDPGLGTEEARTWDFDGKVSMGLFCRYDNKGQPRFSSASEEVVALAAAVSRRSGIGYEEAVSILWERDSHALADGFCYLAPFVPTVRKALAYFLGRGPGAHEFYYSYLAAYARGWLMDTKWMLRRMRTGDVHLTRSVGFSVGPRIDHTLCGTIRGIRGDCDLPPPSYAGEVVSTMRGVEVQRDWVGCDGKRCSSAAKDADLTRARDVSRDASGEEQVFAYVAGRGKVRQNSKDDFPHVGRGQEMVFCLKPVVQSSPSYTGPSWYAGATGERLEVTIPPYCVVDVGGVSMSSWKPISILADGKLEVGFSHVGVDTRHLLFRSLNPAEYAHWLSRASAGNVLDLSLFESRCNVVLCSKLCSRESRMDTACVEHINRAGFKSRIFEQSGHVSMGRFGDILTVDRGLMRVHCLRIPGGVPVGFAGGAAGLDFEIADSGILKVDGTYPVARQLAFSCVVEGNQDAVSFYTYL